MGKAWIHMGILRGTNQVFVYLLCLQNESDRWGRLLFHVCLSLLSYADFVQFIFKNYAKFQGLEEDLGIWVVEFCDYYNYFAHLCERVKWVAPNCRRMRGLNYWLEGLVMEGHVGLGDPCWQAVGFVNGTWNPICYQMCVFIYRGCLFGRSNMNQSKATWLFAFFLWVSRRSDPKGAYCTEAEAQKARLPNPCLGFVFQPGLAGGVIP